MLPNLLRIFAFIPACLVLVAAAAGATGAASLFDIFKGREAALVVIGGKGNEVAVFNGGMAEQPYPPYSTFKIWNALIALQTGVMGDTHERIQYDAEKYPLPYLDYPDFEVWKQPHDMESAFKTSAVWYFREIAGRIGPERMQAWLDTIGYGNRDISSGLRGGELLDDFWNTGSLRISAFEQAELLAKLLRGELPFSMRAIDALRDIAVVESCNGQTLYGKTGAGTFKGDWIGWFVGWIDRGEDRRVFALVMREDSFKALAKARMELAKEALAALGIPTACSRAPA